MKFQLPRFTATCALLASFIAGSAGVGCGPAGNRPLPDFDLFVLQEKQSPTTECDVTCTERRLEFRYVVYVGKQIYAYWEHKVAETRTDFDALAERLEQSITNDTTETKYLLVLRAWAAAFHDGHVNVLARDDLSDIEIFTAPVRLEVLAPATDHEKVVVVEAKNVQHLSVGDEVLSVNGVPVSQALDQAEHSVSGSTKRMRRYYGARRLVDALGAENGMRPLLLTVRGKGGKKRTLSIPRTAELNARPTMGDAEAERSGINNFSASVLPGQIGYLRIDAFGGSQSGFLLGQAMNRLQQTRALLIDVRRNGGGDQSGNAILERLVDKTITRYSVSENLSQFVLSFRPNYFWLMPQADQFAEWHDLTVEAADPKLRYGAKPVMLLTGPACFSACDTFAAALHANGLAQIVGEPTGGGTGTPLVFDLPRSKHRFRYSVVRGKTPDGEWIEGVGTSPDIVLEPTPAERAARRDAQLDRALEFLRLRLPDAMYFPGEIDYEIDYSDMTVFVPGTGYMTAGADRAPVWAQSLDVSPTRADHRDLERFSAYDQQP